MLGRKLDDEDRRHWYRFLDWLLPLPRDADLRVMRVVQAREQEGKVAFITFAERYGMEKGISLGRLQVLLEMRFGEPGKAVAALFRQADLPVLEKAAEMAPTVASLEEMQVLLVTEKPGA